MGEFIDYYEILEVSPTARPAVIDKAYRALMFEEHPDKGGSTAHAQLINEAYAVLSDPTQRAEHDRQRAKRSQADRTVSSRVNAPTDTPKPEYPYPRSNLDQKDWGRTTDGFDLGGIDAVLNTFIEGLDLASLDGMKRQVAGWITEKKLIDMLDEKIRGWEFEAEAGLLSADLYHVRCVAAFEAVIDSLHRIGRHKRADTLRETIGCDSCRTGALPVGATCFRCGVSVTPVIAGYHWGDPELVKQAWQQAEKQAAEKQKVDARKAREAAKRAAESNARAQENRRRQLAEDELRRSEEEQRRSSFWERVDPILAGPTRALLDTELRLGLVMLAMTIAVLGAWFLTPLLNVLFGVGYSIPWLTSAVFTLLAVYGGMTSIRAMRKAELHRDAYEGLQTEFPNLEQHLDGTPHQEARRRSLAWTRRNTGVVVAVLVLSTCASWAMAVTAKPATPSAQTEPETAFNGSENPTTYSTSGETDLGEQPQSSAAPTEASDLSPDSAPPILSDIPDVTYRSLEAASAALESVGLRLGKVTETYVDGVAVGLVISQSPTPGSNAPEGTSVDVVVSKGHAPVEIPNVVGMTLAGANEALFTDRGIELRIASDRTMDSIVYKQSPGPGPAPWPVREIQLWADNPPAADFTVVVETVNETEAHLLATSTSTDDNAVTGYLWTLSGNGLSSSGPLDSKTMRCVVKKTGGYMNTPIITLTALDQRKSKGVASNRYMIWWSTGELTEID